MDEPAAADTGSLASSGSDAALVLAAVDRMQRTELHARLSLIRLRSGLGEMALAVGRAKAKAASTDEKEREIDTAALLDEFEHRIDAMAHCAMQERRHDVRLVAARILQVDAIADRRNEGGSTALDTAGIVWR